MRNRHATGYVSGKAKSHYCAFQEAADVAGMCRVCGNVAARAEAVRPSSG